MRLIQHKKEAYWFYRFLSLGYDRWVNPLFWTPPMRDAALEGARLDDPGLEVLDVGAGTGFTTEGIVQRVMPAGVTMLDQSPHQLARARRKPALGRCRTVLGDAEELPFATDGYDRYVSAGSVEYWPEPQRAVAEAYRVLRPGGIAVIIGPVRPAHRAVRWLADLWMLFPAEHEYRGWYERAGFADVEVRHLAPDWYRGGPGAPYAVAIAARKPAPGASPLALPPKAEDLGARLGPGERLRFAARFVAGSLAGAAFVPLGLVLALRARRAARGGPGA
jgi:MPBQ/MSBQ methyltransferase